MDAHPFADLFPIADVGQLAKMQEDIAAHGQREAIVLFDGKILDGRNRSRCCAALGITPRTRLFGSEPGDGADPLAFVISLNLHRRHLSESQRAMVAERLRQLLARPADEGATLPGMPSESRATLPAGTRSRDVAGEVLNVSPRSVQNAATVMREGDHALVEAVDRGRVAVSTAADLSELPREEQRAIIATADDAAILAAAKSIRIARAESGRKERVDKIERIARGNGPLNAPTRFAVVMADPPWSFEAGTDIHGNEIGEREYPCMPLDEICALDVPGIVTDDAILFLWHPPGMATEAVRVATAWGFRERSSWVWVKPSIGPGYWGRLRHEMVMICTRGSFPAPPVETRKDSVIEAPRGGHSVKPPAVAERIEAMFPTLPKVELFCRSPRAGWFAWGNQAAEKLPTG